MGDVVINRAHGYFTGTDYVSEFYNQYDPRNLDLVRFLNRLKPVSTSANFRYCELGCGHGLTSITLAACYPEAEFFANDLLPAHIVSAKALKDQLGLNNLTFLEADFEQLLAQDYEPFDYIISHGVYSWVMEYQKSLIRQFVDANLATNGVFAFSYNCKAGWSEIENIVELLRLAVTRISDFDTPDVSAKILQQTKQLFHLNKGFLSAKSRASHHLQQLIRHDTELKYLLHEYANTGWRSLHVSEVMEDMAELGLSYSGSINLLDNMDMLLDDEIQGAMDSLETNAEREMIKDLALNKTFRTDIYGKNNHQLHRESLDDLDEHHATCVLMLLKDKASWEFDEPVKHYGNILHEERHGPLLEFVAQGGKSIHECYEFGIGRGHSLEATQQDLMILIGADYIGLLTKHPPDFSHYDRINQQLSQLVIDKKPGIRFLLSPYTRTTVPVTVTDCLFYRTGIFDDAQKLATTALEYCEQNSVEVLSNEGQRLEGVALKSTMRVLAREFIDRKLASFRYFGLLYGDAERL
ncbi:MAG: class I SAM-dependent methyltransferase [Pseudomonadota bacterium]